MTFNLQKLRISIVQYLNTAPLVWGFTNGPLAGKYDLSFTVPSQCAEALRAGAADIAIIPAIEYQRIPGLVVLPDLAIEIVDTRGGTNTGMTPKPRHNRLTVRPLRPR